MAFHSMGEPAIIASCRQTRFDVPNSRSTEINVKGLDLAIIPADRAEAGNSSQSCTTPKAGTGSVDLLNGTTLRLKEGTHYALIGKNGSGKSTLLRAIAKKLVPGLPSSLRISSLAQTIHEENNSTNDLSPSNSVTTSAGKQSVSDFVHHSDKRRAELSRTIALLTANPGDEDEDRTRLRNYRQFHQEQLQKRLLEAQKDAKLRSGVRGATARKHLKAIEGDIAEFELELQSGDSNGPNQEQDDVLAASRLLLALQTEMEDYKIADDESTVRQILVGLGFSESYMNMPVEKLSGGWRMRCFLAAALFQTSDLLILDEPTNYLDLLGIVWLQMFLTRLKDASQTIVVLVSHDREFVDNVCDEVITMRDKTLNYFSGNLSAYEADLRSRILYLSRMQDKQDKERARLEKSIASQTKLGKSHGDENKLRMASSRQKKLDRNGGAMVNATGGRFKLSRDRAGSLGFHNTKLAAIEIPTLERGTSMAIPLATDLRFPGPLVSLENVKYSYPKATSNVLNDISMSIFFGARVGIMGLNGSGKSTLAKLITGNIRTGKGVATHHPRLKLGYYSQHAVEDLRAKGLSSPVLTALGCLKQAMQDADETAEEQEIRGLLGTLGLQGRTASDVPIAKLSGGQLVRLALALVVWNSPNPLVLDEVTTRLDYFSVTALAEALAEYNGAILLVSHNRYMVRALIQNGWSDTSEEGEDDVDKRRNDDVDVPARRRQVYALRAGVLRLQEAGVSAYEQNLEKRVVKMLASAPA